MIPDLYLRPALAFIIARHEGETKQITNGKSIYNLDNSQIQSLLDIGKKNNLKLHRFKKTMGLSRVSKVLGHLQGFYPQNILDIGTGRGVFLWPLLDRFPELEIHCTDILPQRIETLKFVQSGGVKNIYPRLGNIKTLDYPDNAFDVVTFLETLEHIPEPETALINALRMTKKALILSVPSKEDDNPEHINLLEKSFFQRIQDSHAAFSVKFDHVPNHLIVLYIKK